MCVLCVYCVCVSGAGEEEEGLPCEYCQLICPPHTLLPHQTTCPKRPKNQRSRKPHPVGGVNILATPTSPSEVAPCQFCNKLVPLTRFIKHEVSHFQFQNSPDKHVAKIVLTCFFMYGCKIGFTLLLSYYNVLDLNYDSSVSHHRLCVASRGPHPLPLPSSPPPSLTPPLTLTLTHPHSHSRETTWLPSSTLPHIHPLPLPLWL